MCRNTLSAPSTSASAQGGSQPHAGRAGGCFHQGVHLAGRLGADDLGEVLSHAVAGDLLPEDKTGEHHGENQERGGGKQRVVGQGCTHLRGAVGTELTRCPE